MILSNLVIVNCLRAPSKVVIVFLISGHSTWPMDYGLFLEAVDRINHDLLRCIESENIVMTFPVSIFIQKQVDLLGSRGVNPV